MTNSTLLQILGRTTQQSTSFQLSGRMEVKISNNWLQHNNPLCYSYVAERKLKNWLQLNNQLCRHSYLAEQNWLLMKIYCTPCWRNCYGLVVAGITKMDLLWTYILVLHVQNVTSNQDLQRSITKSVWFARGLWWALVASPLISHCNAKPRLQFLSRIVWRAHTHHSGYMQKICHVHHL